MTPDPARAACAGLPDIFESTTLFDHRIAVRHCLGTHDTPACPILAQCQAQTPGQAANHDGTWGAVLYQNGRRIGAKGKLDKKAVA